MRVYLLRHGIAEDVASTGSDGDRRLTPAGIGRMREIAAAYKRIGLRVDRIVTSPLARAEQTARIVAEALGLESRFAVDERVSPGFGLAEMHAIARDNAKAASIMLVGHQPDLGMLAADLAACRPLDLRKGGLVRIEVDRFEEGGGTLEWLLPPAALLGH